MIAPCLAFSSPGLAVTRRLLLHEGPLLSRAANSCSTSFAATHFSFRLYASGSGESDKKRVVFLGTPEVAATTLKTIYEDSLKDGSPYEIVGVVTQPPKRRGRKKDKLEPSPVNVIAEYLGIEVMCPEKASTCGLHFLVHIFIKCLIGNLYSSSNNRQKIKIFWIVCSRMYGQIYVSQQPMANICQNVFLPRLPMEP